MTFSCLQSLGSIIFTKRKKNFLSMQRWEAFVDSTYRLFIAFPKEAINVALSDDSSAGEGDTNGTSRPYSQHSQDTFCSEPPSSEICFCAFSTDRPLRFILLPCHHLLPLQSNVL
mmetsp:Transcript_3697/g.7369  ORF Transcript_3697/g.7369 Transcript_3697/m.7369 type:complete len:115 (+) Transcript_3697:444-788(+)